MGLSNRFAGPSVFFALLLSVWTGMAPDAASADDQNLSSYFDERVVTSLSAGQALDAMNAGVITAEQYVRILLRRVERHSELNALVSIDRVAVIAAARAADLERASGESLKPLLGLPVVVKDSINTAELPTTVGTPALLGFQPSTNAPVVQALLDAGAIILAKSNLHELQAGYLTNNPTLGIAYNPYGRGRTPGGSSGGNASALAARLVPLAIGADTGGSVRVPAALTGTVGFRPTSGRYSQAGLAPLSPTLDSAGPMARSVHDVALADSVITGEPIGLDEVELRGIRIGVPRAFFRDVTDRSINRAIDRAIQRLENAGAELVYADIPGAGPDTVNASLVISFFESVPALSSYLAASGTGVSLAQLASMVASDDVRALLGNAIANPIPETVYTSVIAAVEQAFKPAYVDYLVSNDLDVVLVPTNPVVAPEQNSVTVHINGRDVPVFEAFFALGHYAPLVGAPAVSLPIGQTGEGLPIGGIDITGLPGEDRRVLAIAAAIEDVLPRIRPPVNIRPQPLLWLTSR